MAMHTWFECKIRYEKVMENGMQKKVTEPYLVDALSFTEAEARIIEEMTPFISGEFVAIVEAMMSYLLWFPTLNVPIIANFSPATKKVPTVGSNANLFSSRWTKKAVQRKRLPHRYWYRLPTCAMQLRNWTKA